MAQQGSSTAGAIASYTPADPGFYLDAAGARHPVSPNYLGNMYKRNNWSQPKQRQARGRQPKTRRKQGQPSRRKFTPLANQPLASGATYQRVDTEESPTETKYIIKEQVKSIAIQESRHAACIGSQKSVIERYAGGVVQYVEVSQLHANSDIYAAAAGLEAPLASFAKMTEHAVKVTKETRFQNDSKEQPALHLLSAAPFHCRVLMIVTVKKTPAAVGAEM